MEESPPQEEIGQPLQAWLRYHRLMRFMMVIALLMVGAAFVAIFRHGGVEKARIYVATAAGVGLAMLLMSAAMGVIMLTGRKPSDMIVAQPVEDDEDDED